MARMCNRTLDLPGLPPLPKRPVRVRGSRKNVSLRQFSFYRVLSRIAREMSKVEEGNSK